MIIVIFTMMHKNKIKQEPKTNELIAWLVRGNLQENIVLRYKDMKIDR